MTAEQKMKNLGVPTGIVDAILDTDAYNEIDDQFAIAYMLLSPERIRTIGICAAPFLNARSVLPADGMKQSRREIERLCTLMDREDMLPRIYDGSETFLPDEGTPVTSDAASFIVQTAKNYSPDRPLYVVAIGAITNVASAILLDRETMTENTVVVWLGGHAHHYPDTREFNMYQDVAAARVVFGSGVALVQLPCNGVVSSFRTTEPELAHHLRGKNPLADYLYRNTVEEMERANISTASRVIWDATAVGWLLNDGGRFMNSYLTATPVPEYDDRYAFNPASPMMRYVYEIKRDALFADLFRKIVGATEKK